MLNNEIDYIKMAEQYEKERDITKYLLITHRAIYKAGNIEVTPVNDTYTLRIR